MKLIALATAFAITTTPALAQDFKRITTEADYIKLVVGKKFCHEIGCFTAKKNGRMIGKFGKERLKANWAWRKNFGCRTGTLGKRDLGTDCQKVEISGKQIRLTRNQGKGQSLIYTTK